MNPKGSKTKVASNKSEVVAEIPLACHSEVAAVEFMEKRRWGDKPCCPYCNSESVYPMLDRKTGQRNKRFLWRCKGCGKQYTVRIGTVLEDSRIPLQHWCYAFWRACTSKKGCAAKEIQRQTGLSYKSALFLMHRIRYAMLPAGDDGSKLNGVVECDETYTGGKPRYKGNNKRGRGTKKQPVMAMVERGGRVRSKVIADVTAKTLKGAIREHVDTQARIMTDENSAYVGLAKEYASHDSTTHSKREYVRGDVHSNTAESVFALFKRGVYGIYHNISKTHLHRYLGEFDFRWNTRELEDGERTVTAIRGGIGKRLRYRQPLQ